MDVTAIKLSMSIGRVFIEDIVIWFKYGQIYKMIYGVASLFWQKMFLPLLSTDLLNIGENGKTCECVCK